MGRSYRVRLLVAAIAVFVGGIAWMGIAQAVVPADLKGKFELLKDEPSTIWSPHSPEGIWK